MSRCLHHPGRDAVLTINGHGYCANCQTGIVAARTRVDRHVVPRDCFVWYASANNWQPIAGTGCAHWVAHERAIHRGTPGEQCMLGFPYRVRTLVHGMRTVGTREVALNDIYVTPTMDHTGLVIRVTPRPGADPQITIRHDSSNQGRVADNEFATYFNGRGSFYR